MSNLKQELRKKINKNSPKQPYSTVLWILSVGLSAFGVAVSGYTGTLIFMFLLLVLNDQAAVRVNMFNGQISSIFAFKKVAPLA